MSGLEEVIEFTEAMAELLWAIAQHKYGWTHIRSQDDRLAARELERLGWATIHHDKQIISATDAGKEEIVRRWPVTPYGLGTYDEQPSGWTPLAATTSNPPTEGKAS
ncbi:MAG: hypothetical protein KGZ65_06125 [Sphingomonadales bacterium]|nr:hypothetical protein [Sphingomonadaceae bacterium]MBS3930796.1 hypothetical protein [Sphingomonadales bacterium]